jgi:hypothetical protein
LAIGALHQLRQPDAHAFSKQAIVREKSNRLDRLDLLDTRKGLSVYAN